MCIRMLWSSSSFFLSRSVCQHASLLWATALMTARTRRTGKPRHKDRAAPLVLTLRDSSSLQSLIFSSNSCVTEERRGMEYELRRVYGEMSTEIIRRLMCTEDVASDNGAESSELFSLLYIFCLRRHSAASLNTRFGAVSPCYHKS